MKLKSLGLAMLLLSVAEAQTQGQPAWDQLVNSYFDSAVFPYNPSNATQSGFHDWDGKLENFSAAAIQKQLADLKTFEAKFKSFPGQAADRDLLIASIDSTLLALESIRMWEKNPDLYSATASNGAFVIMSRAFASPEARLRSLIAREKQMPALLQSARANLKNPPRIYTDVALEQLPGIVSFFKSDVPLAFRAVKDSTLLKEFSAANAVVIRELESYEAWIKKDLLPRSNGDFRIGADNYRKKLLYDEMVDIPLDRLIDIGMQDLRKNQQWFRDTAKKIDPSRTPQQILEAAEKNHPPPDKLLQSFTDTLGGLVSFIKSHHIAGVPSPVLPIVEETPPFMRALTFASMDMPGPYERVAKEAFFNVTLPEKTWKPREIEEHMAAFNQGVIVSTAVHEAYPGHYLQGLWLNSVPASKARRLLGANTFIEGWAHYCEQMMLDEGYGAGNLNLRLGQLQDALLRNARYIVGIRMHTGTMTYEQGIDFFVNEGFQTRTNAERETKRGTSDPTYLYYTLGKLEILKLREDYRKIQGARFSLEKFHDQLLSQGMPPLKLIRRTLLGNDSPVL